MFINWPIFKQYFWIIDKAYIKLLKEFNSFLEIKAIIPLLTFTIIVYFIISGPYVLWP